MSAQDSPAPAPTDALATIRAALAAEAAGQSTAVEKLPLGDADRDLVSVLVELLRFARAIDVGVSYFLLELNVGPALNTVQMKGYGQLVSNRVADCLKGKPGAVDGLRTTLERNRKFLLDLNEAYRAAIPRGVGELLLQLSPKDATNRHARCFGLLGKKEALADLSAKHAEITDLPPEDLLQAHFVKVFQEELAKRMGLL